ncbi:MAG: Jag N-terminal domain-containing protein [Candidatus Omnitrophica bacterium]|nr:Jag N-terminal domain-containing protein [Candidatus Omnitrophota bacterium]
MKKERYIEAEGKTIEEAVKNALQILKLPRKCVKIKTLSEEKKGLFGMPGAKPVKVRVTVIAGRDPVSA